MPMAREEPNVVLMVWFGMGLERALWWQHDRHRLPCSSHVLCRYLCKEPRAHGVWGCGRRGVPAWWSEERRRFCLWSVSAATALLQTCSTFLLESLLLRERWCELRVCLMLEGCRC